MSDVSNYILSVTAAGILCGLVQRLTLGKNGTSAVVQSVCAIVLAVTVINPVVKIKLRNIRTYTDGFQLDADSLVRQGTDLSTQELRSIITEQTTAYILEKASSYNCNIRQLEVELTSDSIPIPCGVKISGTFSPQGKNQLSGIIESNLGISKERQQWIYQN